MDFVLDFVPASSPGVFGRGPLAPGTHYHLTLDPAVLWTLSNDTSRPTCSDSLATSAFISSDFTALYKSYFNLLFIYLHIPINQSINFIDERLKKPLTSTQK